MDNWRSLNQILKTLSEQEVKALLDREIAGQRRRTFLKRLHQRYTILRASRERREIFGDDIVDDDDEAVIDSVDMVSDVDANKVSELPQTINIEKRTLSTLIKRLFSK